MGIGKKLEELIQKNNSNVKETAAKIGMSEQTLYSLIKRDSTRIDINTLMEISKALNVEPEYFSDCFNERKPDYIVLSDDEKEIIKNYRMFIETQNETPTRLLYYAAIAASFAKDPDFIKSIESAKANFERFKKDNDKIVHNE